MRIVKEAVYASIFGASVYPESRKKSRIQDELSLEATEDSIIIQERDGSDSEWMQQYLKII